ncbi:hypothetical protein [Agreia sp. VKM Ac-1783]|uniref:hypothetical protein n=1 Tax=Agreia sp. VKM Ac-1783 TaxID=1938889 RepID=UPI000A2ADDB2|nr:hypothetical protein [Agreia sp. VKM Ac-1783]SMQ73476.1 hypothetical protein SAMN06295943_2890 [Agreia sp. VKM Ac-1783]
MSTPRQTLATVLKPLIPTGWRIVPDERTTGISDQTKVTFKLTQITRNAAAPQAAHDIEFIVTITSPREDISKAEDELDDDVVTLLHALDTAGIPWTVATKVLDKDRLGYDITLTLTSEKDKH